MPQDMKKDIKRSIFVGAILLVLMSLAIFIHTKTLDIFVWEGAQVWIEVCSPEPIVLEVFKCEGYDDICVNPNLKYNVHADKAPLEFHFELEHSGVYQIRVNDESRSFLVTRRSPDRYEYFGCGGK